MNNIPAVNDTLALLDSLKQTVRDFAAREEKLETDFHNRSTAALKLYETENEKLESDWHARVTMAEADLESTKAGAKSLTNARKDRIERAYKKVREGAVRSVETQDAQWRGQVQSGLAEAEQKRDADLAAAAAANENFRQKFAETSAAFEQLEKRARRAFHVSGTFRRMLRRGQPQEISAAFDGEDFFVRLAQLRSQIENGLKQFDNALLPRIFRFVPIWPLAIVLLAVAAAEPVLAHFGSHALPPSIAIGALAAFVILIVLSFIAAKAAAPAATAVAGHFLKVRDMLDGGADKIELYHQQEQERVQAEFQTNERALNQRWKEGARNLARMGTSLPMQVDDKALRIHQKNLTRGTNRLTHIEAQYDSEMERMQSENDTLTRNLLNDYETKKRQMEQEHSASWAQLETDWKRAMEPLCRDLQASAAAVEKMFPPWMTANWENWTPPRDFQNAATFARLEVNIAKLADALPKDKRLALPCPPTLMVPLSLVCPAQGSILFETGKTGNEEAVAAINNIIFRIFATTPPGKLMFTIFDPVGLGENFASLMHLADYEESYINSRIWTQSAQFEEKLAELNEHMEKIIQMYLRNEYATITEYNAKAGAVAEKYHFLVIASFPANFSETAARRLRNIAASGARCGVYTFIHWDSRIAPPQDFVPDELRKNSVCLSRAENSFILSNWHPPGVKLILDTPPSDDFATQFLHQVGQTSKDSTRVEVPFEQVAPPESQLWSEETTEELRVPIGRSGATKLQYLAIGKGTRQHTLIAGKTGSGKSTLFHIIITNLALRCSPEQVEFYLVDFKKGVEFKCYGARKLPHAKVVAIESDREFGLSVLQRVDDELRRRGDLFRKVGAQDVAGYKRNGGTEPIPRTLLMIDEFQEFFTEEDRVSQGAAVLLDRIVRQGRAFGIHVLLGSQTLGGAYTLARATIGQMVIRIALQCNEADAYLIMDQDNPAPRLLSRPGEGIYNDAAGAIEGNSPFQAVWLPDTVRDGALKRIRDYADKTDNDYPGPIVFEGNAPADVRDNRPLQSALETLPATPPLQPRVWLGAPNSIKGPTEAVFMRQSGGNLMVVAQSEERSQSIQVVALMSLAAQYPREAARFIVLDNTPPGFPQREFLQRAVDALPHDVVIAGNAELQETMSALAEELKKRESASPDAPEIFVFIQGIHNFKKLKQEDEFSFSSSESGSTPAGALLSLITEGPARGIHVIVTVDTYNNVSRFLGRKALSEFEMRVVFQMSATDSASLIDAPNAGALGLHRALFYNEREGVLETFRPYAQPDNGWIEEIARHFAQEAVSK
ncbi:MAG TPA: FtsK/SpoIIIE domain-containing protein [Candidatus Sulfotelmatobacter sp.]|nr:FtsK/SpoIIIE domain-containing protein [Candidatus Sulfotelmatobacter sp.]